MVRIVTTVAAALLCVQTGQPPGADSPRLRPEPDFLLQSGKAGPIALGDTVDQLYSRFGRHNVQLVDLFLEGMFSPAVHIRLPGADAQPAITAHIREWPCAEFSVSGIAVRDARFRTKDGFGVGSSLGALEKAHRVEVRHGEAGQAAVVSALGLTFMLDDSSGSREQWRITSVWVIPQPVQVRQTRCPHRGPLGQIAKAP